MKTEASYRELTPALHCPSIQAVDTCEAANEDVLRYRF